MNFVLAEVFLLEGHYLLTVSAFLSGKLATYSTLLHSFVIFPMRKTIFGMRGCFPASHGQEMKDLIASRGRRPREAVNVHFQPKWGWKTASSTKNCFSHWENDKWMEYITFFDFAAYASSPPTTRFPLTGFPPLRSLGHRGQMASKPKMMKILNENL